MSAHDSDLRSHIKADRASLGCATETSPKPKPGSREDERPTEAGRSRANGVRKRSNEYDRSVKSENCPQSRVKSYVSPQTS